MLGIGREGSERVLGVHNTLLESFTMIRSQKTAHMNFYGKSAGALQDVLQGETKEDFRGLMVEKWRESGNGGWMNM